MLALTIPVTRSAGTSYSSYGGTWDRRQNRKARREKNCPADGRENLADGQVNISSLGQGPMFLSSKLHVEDKSRAHF